MTAEAVRVGGGSARQRCLELILGKIDAGVHFYLVKPTLDVLGYLVCVRATQEGAGRGHSVLCGGIQREKGKDPTTAMHLHVSYSTWEIYLKIDKGSETLI